MKNFLLGLCLGLLVVPVGVLLYFRFGHPPVATADPKLPFEMQIVRVPLHARIAREMQHCPPIQADEAVYAAGATIYSAQCAACHGLPDRPSPFAKSMFPRAPQLFVSHGDHVGVTDDEPGEIYWKVANGIRLTGMPAYNHLLSETEMWQVTLLLAHADKLPPRIEQQLKASSPTK